ncbi:hypothetical protein SLS53_007772 [Cytospora paraplurivora]|uniref:Major facilitator superfamily (MFS) profile domain-containing protein n=1 Tax=Cytospora paraplurivora TaxID=2898453 RepID=A0AAN9U020_9PEZI
MGEAALTPSDSASSSPGIGRLTPESSDGEFFRDVGDRDKVVADPLLGGHDDEVYELSEGGGGRGAAEKSHDGFTYTAEEEQAVVRKLDHIGNAYVAGMDDDLIEGTKNGTDGPQYYEWALSSFYIAYIAFEWMSLLWNRIPAHTYVSAIVLSWGVFASLQAVSTSYRFLIALRFLLGIGEAGFTGIPIYLSFFFKREELALRTAVFISAAPLATAFASSLAWLIIKLGENGPIAPWRLLFLLEGFPGVVAATVAYRVIPDSPASASYLTKRERKIARSRLDSHRDEDDDDDDDDDDGSNGREDGGGRRRAAGGTLSILRDPVPWATAFIFCLTNMAYASLPVFLPSILTQMGHTPLASQALAAPPYLVSFAAVLLVAGVSDGRRSRGYPIAACALCSSLGYAVLALAHRLNDVLGLGPGGGGNGGGGGGGRGRAALDLARYLAVYPAAVGFFCVVVLTIAWNVNNARGREGAGAGFAIMQVIGQCGPLVGTRLYPKGDGPWFSRGFGVCAVAMLGVAGLALGLRAYLARVNGQLVGEDGDRDGEVVMEEEEGLVGGGGGRRYGRGFRYML